MQPGPLSGCVARSLRTPPPLRETVDRRIVDSHLCLEPKDLPASLPEPEAQLRLLAGEERGEEATHLAQRIDTGDRDTTAAVDEPRGCVPLEIAQPVIDRSRGIALAQAPADHGNPRVVDESATSRREPSFDQLTITVQELDEVYLRRELQQPPPTGVARPGRREWRADIQDNDVRSFGAGIVAASIR